MKHTGETNGIRWGSETYGDGTRICVATVDAEGVTDIDYVGRDRAYALIAALQAALAQDGDAA